MVLHESQVISSCQVLPPLEPVHLQSSHCAHGVQYSPAHS